MKNKVPVLILLVTCIFFTNSFAASNMERQNDAKRIQQVIEELESELEKITKFKDYYTSLWIPTAITRDYEIFLNKYRIKIIKDIYYFKKLLTEIEFTE